MTGPERDKLIEENQQLVWYIMSHYYPSTISSPERDDFFQIGCIGLIRSADNYEPGPVKFSTYAARNIRCRIRNEFLARYAKCRTGETYSLDSPIPGFDNEPQDITTAVSDERYNPEHQFYDIDKFEETLTEVQLTIFKLMLLGYNGREISKKLGCSHQSINQKIDRIRSKFAEFYDHPEWYKGKFKTNKRGRPRKGELL